MEQLERAHTFTINNRIQAERLRENVNKLRVGGFTAEQKGGQPRSELCN